MTRGDVLTWRLTCGNSSQRVSLRRGDFRPHVHPMCTRVTGRRSGGRKDVTWNLWAREKPRRAALRGFPLSSEHPEILQHLPAEAVATSRADYPARASLTEGPPCVEQTPSQQHAEDDGGQSADDEDQHLDDVHDPNTPWDKSRRGRTCLARSAQPTTTRDTCAILTEAVPTSLALGAVPGRSWSSPPRQSGACACRSRMRA